MAPPPETPSRHTFGMLPDQPPDILLYETLWTNERGAQDLHKLCTSDASYSHHAAMRRLVEHLEYVNMRESALRIWNFAIATLPFRQITIGKSQEGTRLCQFCVTYGDVSYQLLT
jgi:hypothetical protein